MPRSFFSISFLATAALAEGLAAQSLNLRAPIAGFVHDVGTRSLRPLIGVPGSVVLGPAILSGIDAASVAPNGSWALIITDGRARLVRGLPNLEPVEVATARELIAPVDRVVWNRNASIAVLESSSTQQLQRINFSAAEAIPDEPVSLPWQEVTSFAMDATGQQLAIGISHSQLYLWNMADSSFVLLPAVASPSIAAFDQIGRLYALDTNSSRILRFDSAGSAAEFAPLSDNDGPTLDPVGFAMSTGDRYLILADRSSRTLRVYETGSGNLSKTIGLDFAPSRVEPVSGNSSFALNDPAPNQWLLILNATDSPSVSFVPARQEELQ